MLAELFIDISRAYPDWQELLAERQDPPAFAPVTAPHVPCSHHLAAEPLRLQQGLWLNQMETATAGLKQFAILIDLHHLPAQHGQAPAFQGRQSLCQRTKG